MEPIIVAEGLTRRFGAFTAVDNVSLEIQKGGSGNVVTVDENNNVYYCYQGADAATSYIKKYNSSGVLVSGFAAGGTIDAILDTTPRRNWLQAAPHLPSFLASPYAWKGLGLLLKVTRAVRIFRSVTALEITGKERADSVTFTAGGKTISLPVTAERSSPCWPPAAPKSRRTRSPRGFARPSRRRCRSPTASSSP